MKVIPSSLLRHNLFIKVRKVGFLLPLTRLMRSPRQQIRRCFLKWCHRIQKYIFIQIQIISQKWFCYLMMMIIWVKEIAINYHQQASIVNRTINWIQEIHWMVLIRNTGQLKLRRAMSHYLIWSMAITQHKIASR